MESTVVIESALQAARLKVRREGVAVSGTAGMAVLGCGDFVLDML